MLIVSTRGRYALRAMTDIAEHNTGKFIALKKIAERQEISVKYLESILPVLVKAGFLEGLRGKGGGYKLTRAPKSYTVGSILNLLEGNFAPVACLENTVGKCPRMRKCHTFPMWKKFQKTVDAFFDGITLADLCSQQYRQSPAGGL